MKKSNLEPPTGFSGLSLLSSPVRQVNPLEAPLGNEGCKKKTPKQAFLYALSTIGLNGIIVIAASGTFRWMNAWLYFIAVGLSAAQTAYESIRVNRETTETDEPNSQIDIPGFVTFLLVLFQMTIPLIAGFDYRWQWVSLHLGWTLWIVFGILVVTPLSIILFQIPQKNRQLLFLIGSANAISVPLLLESGVASVLALFVIFAKWHYLIRKK